MENKKSSDAKNTCIIYSLKNDSAGALAKSLKIFNDKNVNLLHIESRSSVRKPGYEFFVECDSTTGHLGEAIEELKLVSTYFSVISRDYKDNTTAVPWFPRRIRDLDRFANQILSYGSELDSDHPGFTDQKYRERRLVIAFNGHHKQKCKYLFSIYYSLSICRRLFLFSLHSFTFEQKIFC